MNKNKFVSLFDERILKGVAHRGLWDENNSENSMGAFKRAIEHNIAIELDIHLTKDNDLVVIHDEDLKRLTGRDGVVEDLTVKELKENYTLMDGSLIPTFQELLDLVNEQVPLVIELKVFRKNYKELAKKVEEVLLKNMKDKKQYTLISFDPRSLLPLKKLGLARVLLVTHTHLYVYNLFHFRFNGFDIEDVLLEQKRFQKLHKRKFMNVWTIERDEQLKKVAPYVDTVTFQHLDPKDVRKALEEK